MPSRSLTRIAFWRKYVVSILRSRKVAVNTEEAHSAERRPEEVLVFGAAGGDDVAAGEEDSHRVDAPAESALRVVGPSHQAASTLMSSDSNLSSKRGMWPLRSGLIASAR